MLILPDPDEQRRAFTRNDEAVRMEFVHDGDTVGPFHLKQGLLHGLKEVDVAHFVDLLDQVRQHFGVCLARTFVPFALQILPYEAETRELSAIETSAGRLITYLWDLFLKNGAEIRMDAALLARTGGLASNGDSLPDFPGAVLSRREQIYAEEGVRVDPGVIIDASDGPVYLGAESHIMSGAIIQGPVAICERSVIRMGTRIYGGTTIGPVCKVSGEIQNVILYGHTNKAHDGYLGNSLIGEWCNLGANTTTSNLKNNYKPIRIPEWSTGHVHRSALQFFGTVMGDHGKTAINTTLSAGTLCGVFCNIFTYGFPPKLVPSFSWVSPHNTEPYQFEKAMETAEIMMKRRVVPLGRNYLLMMKHIFDTRDMHV